MHGRPAEAGWTRALRPGARPPAAGMWHALWGQAPPPPKLKARLLSPCYRFPVLLTPVARLRTRPPACLPIAHVPACWAPQGCTKHPRAVPPTNRSACLLSGRPDASLSPLCPSRQPRGLSRILPCEEICGRWCAALCCFSLNLGPRCSERSTFLSLASCLLPPFTPPYLPPFHCQASRTHHHAVTLLAVSCFPFARPFASRHPLLPACL